MSKIFLPWLWHNYYLFSTSFFWFLFFLLFLLLWFLFSLFWWTTFIFGFIHNCYQLLYLLLLLFHDFHQFFYLFIFLFNLWYTVIWLNVCFNFLLLFFHSNDGWIVILCRHNRFMTQLLLFEHRFINFSMIINGIA